MLWLECEMFPTGSCVFTANPQLVVQYRESFLTLSLASKEVHH